MPSCAPRSLRALGWLSSLRRSFGAGDGRRVIVVGAGRHGRSIVRELKEEGARIVGLVDDNVSLRRRRILGVQVVGGTGDMATILAGARADEVLVTIPDADRERLAEVRRACEEAGVACRFVHRHTETHVPVAEMAAE